MMRTPESDAVHEKAHMVLDSYLIILDYFTEIFPLALLSSFSQEVTDKMKRQQDNMLVRLKL